MSEDAIKNFHTDLRKSKGKFAIFIGAYPVNKQKPGRNNLFPGKKRGNGKGTKTDTDEKPAYFLFYLSYCPSSIAAFLPEFLRIGP